MNILTNVNLNQNELQNAVLHPLATPPANPKLGQLYYNSVDKLVYQYNGTAWVSVGSVLSVNGKTGTVTLTQDDVGDGATYKRTHNDFTDTLKAQIGSNATNIGTLSGNLNTLIGSDANTSARDIAADEVAKVVAGAPEDFDTLKEVSDWIKSDQTGAAKMQSDISALKTQVNSLIKTATGTISTSGTSATVAYTGTLINAYATMSGELVSLDIEIGAAAVTFATAEAPSAAVTCVVVYS